MTSSITRRESRWLKAVQLLFGIYFVFVGVIHFIVPEGLPTFMSWMYDLDDGLHTVAGVAEILGGLGLILTGLTGVMPGLAAAAAGGLALVMIGAMIWHLGRGEWAQVGANVVVAGLMTYLAYRRVRTPRALSSGSPVPSP